ncbi:MAG: hypothetical protein IPM54_14430 [Polyangiaceae bacterium]|nr:hypothetical protein [Polyangiaceae bacterium]
MSVNPLHLLRVLAKGTNPIAMPDGGESDKKTMRLVLLAIVASIDNDTHQIPDEWLVRIGDLAADVGHQAAARALNALEAAEYLVIDRPRGHGARIRIRLGPKLADPQQWVYKKKQAGHGEQAKPSRRKKEPSRYDQTQAGHGEQAKPSRRKKEPGRNDQTQAGRGEQAPSRHDQTQAGHGEQASPYVSTLMSTQSEQRQLGKDDSEDPYAQYESAGSWEDHGSVNEDPVAAIRRSLNHDPEVESEVRALKDAIHEYYQKRRSDAAGAEERLVQVLLVSRTDSIAKLSPVDVASIPDRVWELARQPKPSIAKPKAA